MSEVVLNAEIRQLVGKHAKQVRTRGLVPGVFYAHNDKNLNIQVDAIHLAPLVFTSKTHVITLKVSDGTSKKCIIRDVQFDPVSDKPVHFDLQGLQEDEELSLDVPVVLIGGTPQGVREGGLLQHMLHKIKVTCLPKDIPEKFEVNVSELAINDAVHVSALSAPGVIIDESPDATVVAVLPPVVIKEEVPAETPAAEAPQEPEVLSKGKKPEEEGAGETEEK
jgi:large subunit ribosomal protein L25